MYFNELNNMPWRHLPRYLPKLRQAYLQVYQTWIVHKHQVGPDSKVRGANMGPIWGRQDRLVIWDAIAPSMTSQ